MASLTDSSQDLLMRPREAAGLVTAAMLRVSQAEARVLEQQVRALISMSDEDFQQAQRNLEARLAEVHAERVVSQTP